ncbi:hypothetical protein ACHAXT_008271 [Thalassiosira profunda]
MHRLLILLLCCAAAGGSVGAARSVALDGDHNPPLRQSSPRQLQPAPDISTGADGSCHLHSSTRPVQNVVAGNGQVFSVQSQEDDDEGFAISSLGFHVDPSSVSGGNLIDYKVYVLSPSAEGEGHYASPERNPIIPGRVADDANPDFDYRGEDNLATWWIEIAAGQISQANLTNDLTTLANEEDFYTIPLGTFGQNAVVGANGDIRSFYIRTDPASFRYAEPEGQAVNDEIETVWTVGPNDPGGKPPKVLVGEGVVSNDGTMPDGRTSVYLPQMFVGRIYSETECPTLAPSQSASPTAAPTATLSDVPSASPTATGAPSFAPTIAQSEMPSPAPTEEDVEEVTSGLAVAMPIPCNEGDGLDDVDEDTKNAMVGATQKTAADAVANDPAMSNINSKLAAVKCRVTVIPDGAGQGGGRRLPTSSSAMDFSMVITGEYRPPKRRPGEPEVPREPPNLGELTEESINRDPEAFVKDLQERAGEASPLQEVDPADVSAAAVDIPEGVDPADIAFTPQPTPRPTPAPTILEEDNNSILVILIVVVAGLIVVLGAFLLYKHGERRAAKARREKVARLEDEKAMIRMERKQEAALRASIEKELRASLEKEQWAKGATYAHPPPQMHGAHAYPAQAPAQVPYGAGPPQPVAPVPAPQAPVQYQYQYPPGTYPPPHPPTDMHASMPPMQSSMQGSYPGAGSTGRSA